MTPSSETTPLVNPLEITPRLSTTVKQVTEVNLDRHDDSHTSMIDPQSISPGKKKLFVGAMIMASFLASLDLTGTYPSTAQIAEFVNPQYTLKHFCQWLLPVFQLFQVSSIALTRKHGSVSLLLCLFQRHALTCSPVLLQVPPTSGAPSPSRHCMGSSPTSSDDESHTYPPYLCSLSAPFSVPSQQRYRHSPLRVS